RLDAVRGRRSADARRAHAPAVLPTDQRTRRPGLGAADRHDRDRARAADPRRPAGVDPDAVEAVIEDGVLVVVGRRTLPPELRDAVIHRLELPQGRFERRIPLPTGRYTVSRFAMHGCVGFSLAKTGRDVP